MVQGSYYEGHVIAGLLPPPHFLCCLGTFLLLLWVFFFYLYCVLNMTEGRGGGGASYLLKRTHQPQWGSPDPRQSEQLAYCSQLSTGSRLTCSTHARTHTHRLHIAASETQNKTLLIHTSPPHIHHEEVKG